MHFSAILVGVTVVTLLLIFGGYKIFLDKPAGTKQNPQTINASPVPLTAPSFPPTTQSANSTPNPSPSYTFIPSPLPKAQPGSYTPIQTSSSTPTTSGSSAISGVLYFNGTAPSGSSVVIAVRPHNSNSTPSQVPISGLNPSTGTTFTWQAAGGSTYDMVAVLKQTINGTITDIAQSPEYTLTAPTSNFQFTINVGYPMAAPTGNITVTCTTHYSNNTWAATVNYPSVTGASTYWLQVGSTSGGTDLINLPTSNQSVGVTLNDSVTYYAQYSVASVSNPTAYQYSSFSSSQQIRCPN